MLWDNEREELSSEGPDYGDRDGNEPEEIEHSLELETDEMKMAGAIGLRAESVEGGG